MEVSDSGHTSEICSFVVIKDIDDIDFANALVKLAGGALDRPKVMENSILSFGKLRWTSGKHVAKNVFSDISLRSTLMSLLEANLPLNIVPIVQIQIVCKNYGFEGIHFSRELIECVAQIGGLLDVAVESEH